jgi:aldehyde:ferredoxin oxidoreductase
MLYIGPAAENKAIPTAVLAKWTHGAGYGGYGAVMGSKNLKAVLANGTGPLPPAADMNKVQSLIDKISKACYGNDSFRRWGTGAAGYTVGHDQSSEPVKNWQEEWHDEASFGVDKFENKVWVKRYWGDFGCPTTCLKVAFVKTGPYKGAIGDNPDYELQAYLGTNLGIFTPEDNVYLTDVIEDLGFCGIQGGNILGFAAELYQRGILTAQDFGGLDLKWGNTKAFASLAQMIADREGIGDILAEGTYRAAVKLSELKGVDVMPYAIHVKGIGIGAHGTRSGLDFSTPVAYVTNVQGGDHTSTSQLPIDNPFSELTVTFYDSGVFCWFNAMNSPFQVSLDFLEAVTGWRITPFQWYNRVGRRIIHMQRVALLLGGPDAYWSPKRDDDIPPRFYEPLPTGPKAGQSTERAKVEAMKAEYYQKIGWGKRGIPRKAELRRLGLEGLSDALKRIKK